jgi:predicted RNA-binding protein with PUA-like domain
MPNYWLLKTEPTEFSFADLQRAGHAVWDGVTNALALKHLRAMQAGDLAFLYHTGDEKQIVGIAEVTRAAYPDPRGGDKKLVVVDLRPREALKKPVPLAAVKARQEFADFELVRLGRLSVMPVSAARWQKLLAMAEK